jgi:hypothetical protein
MEEEIIRKTTETFKQRIEQLLNLCESPIERIFFAKVIDYVINNPNNYAFGLVTWETETEEKDGKESKR